MQKHDALARIAQGVAKFQTEIFPAQRDRIYAETFCRDIQ